MDQQTLEGLSLEQQLIDVVLGEIQPGEETNQILLEVLHQAGFKEIAAVAPGDLTSIDRETGKTNILNNASSLLAKTDSTFRAPFFDGSIDNRASSWLEGIWRFVRDQHQDEDIIEKIREAIEQSVPLEPIVINEFGERICEYPSTWRGVYTSHTRDTNEIGSVVLHDVCNCWADIETVSDEYSVIVCRGCNLRVHFDSSIKTFGELRQYFADKLGLEPESSR